MDSNEVLIRRLLLTPSFVTPGLAASFLGISRVRVWQLIQARKLSTVTFFGARFVFVESILQFSARRKSSKRC